MPPLPPADRARLALANRQARSRLRSGVQQYVRMSWLGLGSWRDDDVDRWVADVVPRVGAAQQTVAGLTAAFIARSMGVAPAEPIDVAGLRGVPPEEVYRRPATTLYSGLAAGRSMGDALQASANRAVDIAVTDVQLANTHQARASMTSAGMQFYQRVLVGPEDCALCMIASTQAYRTGDLLPIHPGCNCDVEPLAPDTPRYEALDGSDRVINPERLEKTHNMVQSLTGGSDRGGRDPDYRLLIAVRDHGELGPTLTFRHQRFTGPDDL